MYSILCATMETTCQYCGKIISTTNSYYYRRHIHNCSNKNTLSLRTTCHDSESMDNTFMSMNNSTMNNSTMNDLAMDNQGLCNTVVYGSSSSDDSDKSDDTSIGSLIGNLYHELNFNDDRDIIIDDAVSTCDSLLIDYDADTDVDDNNNVIGERDRLADDTIIHPFEALSLKFFVDNDIPISLFEEYIRLFLVGKKMDYTPNRKTTTYPYLINRLKASKRFPRHEYVTKKVTVHENIKINIRVFPFLENVKWLLNQKDLLHGSIWKYDSSSTVYSEMNTGHWWKNAEKSMLHRTRNAVDDFPHTLIPIIAFIDKTHCTKKGTINAEPVLISIGNISINKRKNPNAWFNLGYIPSKILTKPERDELKKGPGTRSKITEIYHLTLKVLFDEFLEIECKDYINNQGTKLYIHGKGWVYAHFELSMIIGDSLGDDQLCCHYQGYSSRVQRPMRMCCCTYDDLDNSLIVCKPVIADNIHKIITTCIEAIHNNRNKAEARSIAKSISQELHVSSFSSFKCGGDKEGIYGITPVESLHALLLGTITYVLKCLFEYKILSQKKVNGEEQEYYMKVFYTSEFERRIRILSKLSKRQSYRHMPRSTYSNGVCSLSSLSGQELVGLSILTIIAVPGCIGIDPPALRINIEEEFSELLWMGVSLYESFQSYSVSKDEGLNELETKVRFYIQRFCDICGEQRNIQSEVGTKLTKLHSLIHLVKAIPKYGTPLNYFGGYMEKNLKSFVKYPSKRTRLISGDPFLLDLSNRWSERSIIDDYYSTPSLDIDVLCNRNNQEPMSDDNLICSTMIWGKEKFRFQKMNTEWNTVYKDLSGSIVYEPGTFHPYYKLPHIVQDGLNQWINNVVPDFVESVGCLPSFISCHYDVKDKSNDAGEYNQIYRSSPSYRGEEWFDWVNIEYEDDHENKYNVPTKTFLWMIAHFNDISVDHNEFVLGWPLRNLELIEYPLFDGLKYDKFYHIADVYCVATSLQGVAYVLPAVDIDCESSSHCDEENRKGYLNDLNDSFYISIPPRYNWTSIGWKGDDFEHFKDEWQEVRDSHNDDDDGSNKMEDNNEHDNDDNLNMS